MSNRGRHKKKTKTYKESIIKEFIDYLSKQHYYGTIKFDNQTNQLYVEQRKA